MRVSIFLVALAICPVSAGAQQANFCSIGQYGGAMNCSHATLSQCQSMARTMGGQCVIQSGAQQPQAQSFADAYYRGQQAGIAVRESRARAALLEEQAEALRQQRSPEAPSPSAGDILFRCPTQNGGTTMTTTPAIGCVVAYIGPL